MIGNPLCYRSGTTDGPGFNAQGQEMEERVLSKKKFFKVKEFSKTTSRQPDCQSRGGGGVPTSPAVKKSSSKKKCWVVY